MSTYPLFQRAEEEALAIRTDCTLAMVPPDASPTIHVPLVWVDVTNRSDVGNLWMQHERYGEGEQRCQWLYAIDDVVPEQTIFYLSCEVIIPSMVPVSFFVAFPLPSQAELIKRVAEAPLLGIMTEPFPIWKEHQHEREPLFLTPELIPVVRKGIILEIGSPELLEMLHVWQARFTQRHKSAS